MPAVLEPETGLVCPGRLHWAVAAGLLPLFVAAALVFLHFYNQQNDANHHRLDSFTHNDLIGRHFATREALHGQDPYTLEMTRRIQEVAGNDPTQGFDYPILLAILLLPVASVPWPALRIEFLVVFIPALFVSFRLCISFLRLPLARGQAIVLALLCLGSWPVIFGLRLEQPTLLLAVFLFPAFWLISRERYIAAGILLALSTFKPQLVLLLLAWLLLWSCARRCWKLPAAFAVAEGIYLGCGESLVPGWFPNWLYAIRHYQSICPSLPMQLVLGRWLGLFGTLIVITLSLRPLWRARRCGPASAEFAQATALLLALAICITPSSWAMVYNHVLLIPACLLILFTRRQASSLIAAFTQRLTQIFVVWIFVSVLIVAVGLTLHPASFWTPIPFLNHLLAPTIGLALLAGPLRRSMSVAELVADSSLTGLNEPSEPSRLRSILASNAVSSGKI